MLSFKYVPDTIFIAKSHEEVHSQQTSQLQKVCPLAHSRGEEGHEKAGQSSQGSQAA